MSTATDTFTAAYFRSELLRFREAFGRRDVMTDKAKRDLAFKAFAFVYLNTEPGDERADVVSLFDSTVQEFEKRCFYMDMMTKRQ